MRKSKQATSHEGTSREKLIRSAERLFAEHGFDGVSVRDIANDAKVNSALVGYYFQSKEGLLSEVYTRHCEPLKAERARLLKQYSAKGRVASLEEVLEAFIRPSLEANQSSNGNYRFTRLRAILSAENSSLLEQLVGQNFDQSSKMFVAALSKCLPHLTREDVFWRFHFLLGAIYYTATGPHRVAALTKGVVDPSDPRKTCEQLVRFAAAGFRSGSVSSTRSKVKSSRKSVS